MAVAPSDEGRHREAAVEEWVFAAWSEDARTGILSAHRLIGRRAWYWAAVGRAGEPLLHVAEWDVAVRADPMIVKAEALWAEHTCEQPMEQWSVGNETYAAALDDPGEGLGRAYGMPTPIALDLEWYATAPATAIAQGYEQPGVVHGVVEIGGQARVDLAEVPAHRWHRWTAEPGGLPPLDLPVAHAHTGVRAPFAFPDGTSADLVLTAGGWRARTTPTVLSAPSGV